MTDTTIMQEHRRAILGVSGRAFAVIRWAGNGSEKAPNEIANQTWKSVARPVTGWGNDARITVKLRYDDSCLNGHKTFAITAEIWRPRARDVEACGCLHDEIATYFPELAPLIKWHGVMDDGPLHYIANTTYHASDKDYNGLRKGEKKQLRNGKTGIPAWKFVTRDECGKVVYSPSLVDSEDMPEGTLTAKWEPAYIHGEGKERDLAAARSCAVWPDAPDEILLSDKATLKAALEARLPALMAEFWVVMTNDCKFIQRGIAEPYNY